MFIEQRIFLRRTFGKFMCQLLNMGLLFFVPLMVYYMLIPILICAFVQNPLTGSEAYDYLEQFGYFVVPIFSTWWVHMFLKEYVEGDGREVLLLGGGIASLSFMFFLLHSITLLPMYLFFDNTQGEVTELFLQFQIISFLMCGITLYASTMLKSISLSALIVMAYCAWSNVVSQNLDQFDSWKFTNMRPDYFWGDNSKFLLIGIVFWVLGVLQSRKME